MEDNIYYDIRQERAAQDGKWGDQNHVSDLFWLPILVEEVGEVAREICELNHKRDVFPRDLAKLRGELIQVAAVAVAWLEAIDNDTR